MQKRTHAEQRVLVQARYEIVQQTANANAAAYNKRAAPFQAEYNRRSAEITRSRRSMDQKFRMLYALTDALAAHMPGVAACRRGCSHCCHIAVGMLQGEAEVLGRAIGVKPAKVKPVGSFAGFDYGYHNPCVFLRDGECSIYEHRPLACRAQFNMDADELLCELYPPDVADVPFWNNQPLQRLSFQISYQFGKADTMQDIRAFFPTTIKPRSTNKTNRGS